MRCLIPNVVNDATDSDLACVYSWPDPLGLPWVRMNFATTIDGAVTDSTGLSAGVSSEDDKRVFALLRATCDVVLVGAGTATAENYGPVKVRPSMSSLRTMSGRDALPRLVIVTNSATISPDARAFADHEGPRTTVVTCGAADPQRVDALRQVADVMVAGDETVDLLTLMTELSHDGERRVLCEGGPTLFASLLEADLVDDLCLTTSPIISGQQVATRPTLIGRDDLTGTQDAQLAGLVSAGDSLLARWQLSNRR